VQHWRIVTWLRYIVCTDDLRHTVGNTDQYSHGDCYRDGHGDHDRDTHGDGNSNSNGKLHTGNGMADSCSVPDA